MYQSGVKFMMIIASALIGVLVMVLLIASIFGYAELQNNQNKIYFAGKVINNQTREWPNNRLVVVYLHKNEVGRQITAAGEFSGDNTGMQDGLFTIPVSNTYKLDLNSFEVDGDSKIKIGRYQLSGMYLWFELEEGKQIELRVPSKNLTYVVKSVSGDATTLPPQLLSTKSTHLTEENEIVVNLPENTPTLVGNTEELGSGSAPNIENISYTDTTTETVNIYNFSVPLNNCGGSGILRQDIVRNQTTLREYHYEVGGQLGAEISIPMSVLWPKLIVGLQAKYGFEEGQTKTQTISYHVEAQPGTNQVYDFRWNELWELGTAHATVQGEKVSIPYKVRADLMYEVASRKLACQ